MEGYSVRLLLRCIAKLRLEHVSSSVRPETDCTIGRACGHEFFLYAHVEAMDLLGMERGDQVLVLLPLVRSTKIDHDLYQLA